MEIKKTTNNDIECILEIYEQAKQYLKNNNVNQWQNGTPNLDTLKNDIENQISYSVVLDDEILGTAAIILGTDHTYNHIYNGSWLTSNNTYAVIHRIATSISSRNKGIASKIISFVENLAKENNIKSVRCDTHEDNLTMQHTLLKNGFIYCGEITIDDGTKRLAYEKII